jgi:uncharacterized membrane protein
MKGKGYVIYIVLVGLLTASMFLAPLIAPSNLAAFSEAQSYYAPLCHQLTSRSLCYFPEKGSVEDCITINQFSESKDSVVNKNGVTGYKFPVCSRDVGIYVFMFIGGIVFAFRNRTDSKEIPPAIWLILALIPIGIDGGGQFIDLWESTNTIRLITGAIAGFAVPFYLIPLMNRWFG